MNSYFEQTAGFYGSGGGAGPTATGAEQAYRFPQGLLVPPAYPAAPQASRPESYVDPGAVNAAPPPAPPPQQSAASKLYPGSATDSVFKPECLVKEQNGFDQAVKSWTSSVHRAAAAAAAASDPMRPFDARGVVSDAWSTCCQNSPVVAQAPTNAFYPWMAIAGLCEYPSFSLNLSIPVSVGLGKYVSRDCAYLL
ncbi:Ubx [Cordylochernes scorpioides]|uniref:Ubx n=1 Tax=Cordylochernes scorpioides TaxID=51811 RepID=A0ABY6LRJ8_9ARAC|nr:Ubx [Cordylochernes scorpioides]UYV83778.1 Ubx [Cordylochernes scorpioides]